MHWRRLLLVVVAFAVVVITVLAFVDNGLHRGRALRNVSLAGVSVGGQSDQSLRRTLHELEPQLGALPVELVSDDRTDTTTGAGAGLHIDTDATIASVKKTGRSGISSPLSWISGLFSDRDAQLRVRVDEATLADVLRPFTVTPNDEPRFEIRGGTIVAVAGEPGSSVDVSAVGQALARSAAHGDNPIHATVEAKRSTEHYTDAQLDAMADAANHATLGGLRVRVGERQRSIDQQTLRTWLRPDTNRMAFTIDANLARDTIATLLREAGAPGSDATFTVDAGVPVIHGGDPATSCCADDTASRVLATLSAGNHDVELALTSTPRPRGREWAHSLGINEVVGDFTTRYPAGQPRVTNIKRIAELTRSVVIEPGATFSVNEFIGPRTAEKGFVSAGAIQNGVFQEDVGGGISQFATTLFNAAFFAGLDYGGYQSHSIYISRYPYGREATLSYPAPDLKIVNSTPYGILIWATATETSVRVQLFSTKFATGEQTGQTQRPLGAACTRVVTERTRSYADGRAPKIDTVTATYRPEGVDCNGSPSAPTVTAAP